MTLSTPIADRSLANRSTTQTRRRAALVAGISLLLMIVPAVFANFVVVEGMLVPDDAAATAANIAAGATQFRLGILSFFTVIALDIVVAWALYAYFEPVNRSLALLTGWLRLAYAAVFAVTIFDLVNALRYATDAALTGSAQLQTQAWQSANAFADNWSLSLSLFGLHLIVVGLLTLQSRRLPGWLGVLVLVAGAGYLFDAVVGLLLPDSGLAVGQFTFLGELLLAFWLLRRKVALAEAPA